MKKYYLHIIVVMGYFLFVAGSCGEEPEISGCTDSRACNYNIEATIDNGNCILSEENLDCNGNCIIQTDDGCECAVLYDECGFCDGDNSSCTDCNGEVNGHSILDICETCDNDPSNDCVQDCAGVWGGTAVDDECDVCDGDNSTCLDCTNEPGGDSILDMCETCDNDPSNDCVQDCAGVWGGTAVDDECGVCGGNNSTCTDCNSDINGNAFTDGCGDCVGGNTDLAACAEDCLGVDGGSAYFDNCSECVPEGDISCLQGCDGNYANDGTHEVEDECGICNGDDLTCADCAGVPNGDSFTDNCGECVAAAGDISCVEGCDGNYANDGTQAVDDECGVCGGDDSSCADCTEVPNGDSFTDNCGECVAAGDISCVQGCNGNYANNGTQVVDDECGICDGDNSTCTDCNGVINGLGFIDYCGHCIESMPSSWKIEIVAELALMNSDLDTLIDGSSNYLGADILYTDGFDGIGIDIIEFNNNPNASLSFSFYHGDWDDAIINNQQYYYFTQDIRNHNYNDFLNDGKTWNAELKSINNWYNGTAKLTFNFIDGLSDANITVDVIGSNLSGTIHSIKDGDSISGIIMSYNTIVNFEIQISNLCY